MKDGSDMQIPPKIVVRIVGAVLLLPSLVVIFLSIRYFHELGTLVAATALIGGSGLALASEEALRNGKPGWLLVNFLFPW